MNKSWTDKAWDEYLDWHTRDKKIFKRINQLIEDIDRNGNEGLGRPEQLKHEFSGLWSRRIDGEHRLVYKLTETEIIIVQCRSHYK
ncbi:Txe/YoeB family addiction module toxin [Cloacibacillus porcorum]|jgi:toxin YoeB|uniref:Putative mRNA interferase YoeB n=1 Tax=Cloacibacillus porcorum TaxID=1197717 RepID=A0A1B2I2R7_9BACT|nr:Txe/YoeB family addiction module toxin [Cloacibacillus porcorum]ANZ44237.1 addiction module protein [Cloacibacillus porcorum]